MDLKIITVSEKKRPTEGVYIACFHLNKIL